MKRKALKMSIFHDFGVPLFLIGADVPTPLRTLAPEGVNWISLPKQANERSTKNQGNDDLSKSK
jgi:hypothetical protein